MYGLMVQVTDRCVCGLAALVTDACVGWLLAVLFVVTESVGYWCED